MVASLLIYNIPSGKKKSLCIWMEFLLISCQYFILIKFKFQAKLSFQS